MRNHNSLHNFLGLIVCLFVTSCATTHVPSDWLESPENTVSDGYGGWIDITTQGSRLSGELIAIHRDTVFIANDQLRFVITSDIVNARLVFFDASNPAGSVILGTLLTVSNGVLLLFTAPMWIIGGTIAARSRTYEPIVDYPDHLLTDLNAYARFPAGIPQGLDRTFIKMKPKHRNH